MNEQYNDSSYSFLPSCDGWCAVLCWSIIMVPISIWQLQSSLCLIQSDQRTSWVEKAGCGQQQKRQHPVRGGGLSTREVNLTPELSSNKIAVNSMHSSVRSSFKQSQRTPESRCAPYKTDLVRIKWTKWPKSRVELSSSCSTHGAELCYDNTSD